MQISRVHGNAATSVTMVWSPPDRKVDWLKVNVDGAVKKDGAWAGGGVVICDHHGIFHIGPVTFFLMSGFPNMQTCWLAGACREDMSGD